MSSISLHDTSRWQALLQASQDAIIEIAMDDVIVGWSPAAERLFGYTTAEIVGQSIAKLGPPQARSEMEYVRQHLERNEPLQTFQSVRLTRSGEHLDVQISVAPIYAEHTLVGALVLARDITAQQRAAQNVKDMETHARHRAVLLNTSNRVALDILASRTGVEALRHIAEAARVLANARYAALGVANADGTGLKEFITVGLTPEEEAAIGPRPIGAGVLGLLLQRSEPLRIDRIGEHPAAVGYPSNHPPMESFLGVPIRRGDVVVGSLYLTDKQGGGSFSEADQLAVQALGAHAAVAIHNLQMLSRQRDLVRNLINAQEEERRAVAYDLHDGLTQYVMAAHAHLESFRRAHDKQQEERATRELEVGQKYLKEAVVESRRLINGLRLLALDDLGLVGAIEQLLHEEKSRAGWNAVEWRCNLEEQRFDRAVETGVYRVAQEALTNVRKHAAANQVCVHLWLEPGTRLRLEVRDWGQGFIPTDKTDEYGHVGLHGMLERVNVLGGHFELRSAPGEGTQVVATFPALDPHPEDDYAKVSEKRTPL
jgi:PAS domain S-box-containing protein